MTDKLVHIGFGNMVNLSKISAIADARNDSAPIKRLESEGRSEGLTINMAKGKKAKSLIFLDNGRILLSTLAPKTIAGRVEMMERGEKPTRGGNRRE